MKKSITILLALVSITCFGQVSDIQVISNANSYKNMTWSATSNNIVNKTCNSVTVTTPSWVSIGTNTSMPYCWGGHSTITSFKSLVSSGKSAGDKYTSKTGYAGSSCATGSDCSGFVGRCYGLSTKYSTNTLNSSSLFGKYSSFSSLRKGDFVNDPGSHTRLVVEVNNNGSYNTLEQGQGSNQWKVFAKSYTTSQLSGYNAQYYKSMTVSSAPDLVIERIYTEPSSPKVGENVDLKVEFKNNGNAATTQVIELDYKIDGLKIGSDSHSSLDKDETRTEYYNNYEFLTEGTYRLCVYIDSDPMETNTLNNSYCVDVIVESKSNGPEDVVAENYSVDKSTVKPGEPAKVTFDHVYIGDVLDADMPTLNVEYYWSDDKKLDEKDIYLGRDISGLGSDDDRHDEDISFEIPESSNGVKYVLIEVDSDDEVAEIDENNTFFIPVTVSNVEIICDFTTSVIKGEQPVYIDIINNSTTDKEIADIEYQFTFYGANSDGTNLVVENEYEPTGILYSKPGIYRIKQRICNADKSNCKSCHSSIEITNSSLSLNSQEIVNENIYPNPVERNRKIMLQNEGVVSVYNQLGKKVFASNSPIKEFRLDEIAGQYLVIVKKKEQIRKFKLVIL